MTSETYPRGTAPPTGVGSQPRWEHSLSGVDLMETMPEITGLWSVFFLLVIVAMQIGAAAGFVWLIVHLATRKTTAKTDARLQELEQRIARIESSTPHESRTD